MTIVLLFFLLVLVVFNGLFVAAEIGLVRSRKGRLEAMAKEGHKGAGQALDQVEHLTEYIAACQVGITLCSIGIGFLGEPSISKLLEPVFGGLSHAVAATIAVVLAFLIVTSLHISFGELTPKMVAIAYTEGAARRLARPLGIFRRISAPFTIGLTAVAERIARMFGVSSETLSDEDTSADDIRILIAQSLRSRTGDSLDPGEAGMLGGVFHLHEQEAREVMTPIPAVVTVDASEAVETALRRCVTSGHTRLVVTEDENPDRIKGIVHNNSLARLYMDGGPEAPIEPVIRDALIVPEVRPLDDLLQDLQRQRTSISVVVDEYGRTVGLVTVEDILEEVVGEIEDETDPRAGTLRRLTNGEWFVRGHVSLGDLEDAGIELPVETDAFNSIGGYVFAELGRLPKRGDSITADGYVIRVESVRENRIEAVRIRERRAGRSETQP
jgi:CBS domain containing-hemolysin-like protein